MTDSLQKNNNNNLSIDSSLAVYALSIDEFMTYLDQDKLEQAIPVGYKLIDLRAFKSHLNGQLNEESLDEFEACLLAEGRIKTALENSQAEVEAYLTISTPATSLIKRIIADLAIYEICRKQLTEDILERYKNALKLLKQFANGKLQQGTEADIKQPVTWISKPNNRYGREQDIDVLDGDEDVHTS